jgi:transposase
MALIMVMTLSLLIYSIAEMRVHEALQGQNENIWDQKKRPTQRHTIRWVFYIFDASKKQQPAMKIREEHCILLRCLSPLYVKMYFL